MLDPGYPTCKHYSKSFGIVSIKRNVSKKYLPGQKKSINTVIREFVSKNGVWKKRLDGKREIGRGLVFKV